jgi:hypothetical protein
MRDVLHRGDLALYADILIGMEVQLHSYNVIHRCAVWLGNPSCPKNCSLATNGYFGAHDEAPVERSFYLWSHKPAGILVDSHTICTGLLPFRCDDAPAFAFVVQRPTR